MIFLPCFCASNVTHPYDCGAQVFYLLGYCDYEGFMELFDYSVENGITRQEVILLLNEKGESHVWKNFNYDDIRFFPDNSATILWLEKYPDPECSNCMGHYAILINNEGTFYVIDPQEDILSSNKVEYEQYFEHFDLEKSRYVVNTSTKRVDAYSEKSYLTLADITRVLNKTYKYRGLDIDFEYEEPLPEPSDIEYGKIPPYQKKYDYPVDPRAAEEPYMDELDGGKRTRKFRKRNKFRSKKYSLGFTQ